MAPAPLPVDVATVSGEPGVYLFRDGDGRILYVGKAASLRARLASYAGEEDPRKRAMLERVAHVETILTDSEKEALILEASLIKEHKPRYNVRLADDKRYPYIELTKDPYPRIRVTRQRRRKGSRYFGPFPDATAAKRTLQVLREAFKLRDCKELIPGGCLNYQMDLCWAPCIQEQGERERKGPHVAMARADPDAAYAAATAEALKFLRGDAGPLKRALEREMAEAAEGQEYERAARLRDRLRAIDATLEKQAIFSARLADRDVFALHREADLAVGLVQLQRGGRVVGQNHHFLRDATGDDGELLAQFVARYYEDIPKPPPEVVVPGELPGAGALAEWLSERRGTKVVVHAPQRGEKRRQVDLARKNAEHKLRQARLRRGETHGGEELAELADALDLPEPPRVIEAYDVSHIQGEGVVASRVALVDGRPAPDRYRRYKLRADKNDDYAAMREVVERRFQRLLQDEEDPPDLVLIDGGRGQLGAASDALEGLGLARVPLAALAKREEEVYLPKRRFPVRLPRRSPGLHALQRARDEAHRFALDYQRRLRGRKATASPLDDVPGVGPARRRGLMRHFGSWQALRGASEAEIAEAPGIGPDLARSVRSHLDALEVAERRRGGSPGR